ncbi:cytochrome c3 family protein [Urbifossiella limnaea]|uniref:cytochrome c3 family protein n=1 Tax=Urbifossiella limnaea TaxID=2528023 RepID=UPI0011A07ECE|nr:cytochrome c3 family protein [Urbifossiella limnaea]
MTPADTTAATGATRHPVVVRTPPGPPVVPTGTVDEKGRPVSIACATCHASNPANPEAKLGTPLTRFHQGLTGKHGNLTCTSCHNPADGYASLRLADGKSVPYTAVMTLCAQCHGPQFRDYQHGAHGGMTGHWDLSKGGRSRNNCVDCHDPHAPKYPTVTPAPGPNDRFQTGGGRE